MSKKTDIQKNGSRPDRFVNSRGIEVVFAPVSRDALNDLVESIRQKYSNEPLNPPTYQVEVFGGGKKVEPHNLATIEEAKQKAQTDEEKAAFAELETAWNAHIDAKSRFDQESALAVLKMLVIEGIANPVPEEWIKRRKFIGVPVPDDEFERKWVYARSELIVTAADGEELQIRPLMLTFSGLTPEEFSQIERRFRGTLETVKNRTGTTAGEPDTE